MVKGFLIGWFLGMLVAGAALGALWKSSVTSGDYFKVGSQFYFCNKARAVFQPDK